MARKPRESQVEEQNTDTTEQDTTGAGEEQMLDGMPQDSGNGDTPAATAQEKVVVPKELRPLFNEIGRLSGFLALARRAVYADDPARAAEALELIVESAPTAAKVARVSVE